MHAFQVVARSPAPFLVWQVDRLPGYASHACTQLAKGVDKEYGITSLGDVKWVLGMLVEHDRAASPRKLSSTQD